MSPWTISYFHSHTFLLQKSVLTRTWQREWEMSILKDKQCCHAFLGRCFFLDMDFQLQFEDPCFHQLLQFEVLYEYIQYSLYQSISWFSPLILYFPWTKIVPLVLQWPSSWSIFPTLCFLVLYKKIPAPSVQIFSFSPEFCSFFFYTQCTWG